MTKSKNEMSPGCFTSFMVFFLLIALGLLLWAYNKYHFTKTVIQQDLIVVATVVDMNQQQQMPGNHRNLGANKLAPSLEFVFEEDTINIDSEQYSDVVDYNIGEEVEVYVNPVQPTQSIINTWSEKWGGATLLGVLGGIFLLLSVGSMIGQWLK